MNIQEAAQKIRRIFSVKSLKGIRPHVGGFIYFIEINSTPPSFIIGKTDDCENLRTLCKYDSELHATEKWEAKTKGLWIPVEDALPEDGELALIFTKWRDYAVAAKAWEQGTNPNHWRTGACSRLEMSDVTHWMPLPKHPN